MKRIGMAIAMLLIMGASTLAISSTADASAGRSCRMNIYDIEPAYGDQFSIKVDCRVARTARYARQNTLTIKKVGVNSSGQMVYNPRNILLGPKSMGCRSDGDPKWRENSEGGYWEIPYRCRQPHGPLGQTYTFRIKADNNNGSIRNAYISTGPTNRGYTWQILDIRTGGEFEHDFYPGHRD